LWLHSLKVAQLLRSAACLHTNQSQSYLNHLVVSRCNNKMFTTEKVKGKANYSNYGHKMLHPNTTVKLNYHYFILCKLQAERMVNAYSVNFKKPYLEVVTRRSWSETNASWWESNNMSKLTCTSTSARICSILTSQLTKLSFVNIWYNMAG